jgi:hypothetical protein
MKYKICINILHNCIHFISKILLNQFKMYKIRVTPETSLNLIVLLLIIYRLFK